MNHTSRTHASDDFGHHLTEIVDHLTRAGGFAWSISLAVINQQGWMVLLTMKTGMVGVILHDTCVESNLELVRWPPMHPPRRGRRNLQRYMVQPYWLGTCARRSCQETRPGAD
jgi:hypothetical protein